MDEHIKIFTRGSDNQFEELEKEVNRWLSENKVNITSRKIATTTGVNKLNEPFVNCTIVFFYTRQ
jgi:hypothetical protein